MISTFCKVKIDDFYQYITKYVIDDSAYSFNIIMIDWWN